MKLRVPVPAIVRKLMNYYAPMEGRGGKLRLDFNENTVGCSPAVLRSLRKLTAEDLAMYSEYQAPTERLARWFGVQPSEFMLTNGADGATAADRFDICRSAKHRATGRADICRCIASMWK